MEEIITAKLNNADRIEVSRDNAVILLCSILLGIVFNLLFYDRFPGISYPVFIITFYAVFFINNRDRIELKLDFGGFLAIPVLALSFTYAIFSNEIFGVLNFLAVPVLVVAHTVMLTKRNSYKWFEARFIGDVLYGLFGRTLGRFFRGFELAARLVNDKYRLGRYARAGKVLIGLLISIPLMIVLINLLSSADQIFSFYMGKIPDFLRDFNIGELLARSIIILCVSSVAFSYLYSLTKENKTTAVKPSSGVKQLWDPVVVVTVLVSINAVYVFFVLIQFSYLFGSLNYALPPDFTYAEYARRGFFELNFVTVINLGLLLVNLHLTKRENSWIDRAVRSLNSLLIVCTMVMSVSAFCRMALYEQEYGYTYLRILTHAFMVFIFALLVATIFKVWNEEVKLLKSYIIIALVAYTLINYINIDRVIVRENIDRFYKTGNIDINYLTGLSYDAVPGLIEFANENEGKIAVEIQNKIEAKKHSLKGYDTWQEFNLSRYLAKKSISD